jgi:hypothetical protein
MRRELSRSNVRAASFLGDLWEYGRLRIQDEGRSLDVIATNAGGVQSASEVSAEILSLCAPLPLLGQ